MAAQGIVSVNSDSHFFTDSRSSSYADVLPPMSRYPYLGGGGGESGSCLCHRCRRVAKEYSSLRRVNYVIAAICVIVFAVYVATIVHFWRRFPIDYDDGNDARAAMSGAVRNEHPYCVPKNMLFKKEVWEGMDHSVTSDKYCFKNLDWIPALLNQAYYDLENRVKTVEEGMQDLRAGSSGLTMATTNVDKDQVPIPVYQPRPFAHMVLDIRHDYKADEMAVKWASSGMVGSNSRDMMLNGDKTDLVIKIPGYYYVYSHLEFDPSESESQDPPRLQVYLNWRDNSLSGRRKLLESPGPNPFVQGVFLLRQNDSISVRTDTSKLYVDASRSNYLGIFLI